MRFNTNIRVWSLAALLGIAASACQPAAAPKAAGKSGAKDDTDTRTKTRTNTQTNTESNTDTNTSTDCTVNASTSTTSGTDTNSSVDPTSIDAGLRLTTTKVTYNNDIQSLLQSKCASCHSGQNQPDISTYNNAKANISQILTDVNGDKMPKDTPLTSDQKLKLTTWQNDGLLESSTTDTSTNTSSTNTTSTSSTGCGTSTIVTDTSNEISDGWGDLINPKAMQDCRDKGKIYDRSKDACHKADLAKYSCDDAGITAAFQKIGVNVDSQVKSFEGDGYQIDQCGEFSGDPIIYFYKKGDGGDDLKLSLKKLCKKGSPACS